MGIILNFVLQARFGVRAGIVEGELPSFIGAVFLFAAFGAFYAVRGVGAGDVKLMAAVGAFLRWPATIWVLAFVLFAGAFNALVYAAIQGHISAVARNMLVGIQKVLGRSVDGAPFQAHIMPCGPAILLGVAATVLFRYRTFF